MKDHECTEQRFLDDVKNHQINIVKDDGVHRFVRFKRPDSTSYWFDLITWPGFLCISGDCGTYVFSRIEDMFDFFKMKNNDFNKNKDRLLNINPGYWGEKLEAIGRQGYMEFDSKEFEDKVKRCFESYFESEDYSEEVKKDVWQEIKSDVLFYSDDEHEAHKAAHDFRYNLPDGEVFEFVDFFDYGSAERFTWHYIWNLYAIVWGIEKYDEAKNEYI